MLLVLPYADFKKSAEVFELNDCIIQAQIAKNVIECLESGSYLAPYADVRPWINHVPELKLYWNALNLSLFDRRGYYLSDPYMKMQDFYPREHIQDKIFLDLPEWFGDKIYHKSVMSYLIAYNSKIYKGKFEESLGPDRWVLDYGDPDFLVHYPVIK